MGKKLRFFMPLLTFLIFLTALPACGEIQGFLKRASESPGGEGAGNNVPAGQLWVKREFKGPPACGPGARPGKPPVMDELEKELEAKGVSVYGRRLKHFAVCKACHCPAYHLAVYFRIEESGLAAASALGYRP